MNFMTAMDLVMSCFLFTETECPAGEELVGDTCTACQSGFYKSRAGNEMCRECPTNTEAMQGTDRTTCRRDFIVI